MTSTGYAYDVETRELLAVIKGEQAAVERTFARMFDDEQHGLTYSPAFGANDGLIDNGDADTILATA